MLSFSYGHHLFYYYFDMKKIQNMIMKKHQSKNDENLLNVNKTRHQKEGERKV